MSWVHVIYTGIVSFVPLPSGVVWMVMPTAAGDPHHPHQAHLIVEDRAAAVTGLRKITSVGGLTAYALEDHQIDFGLDPVQRTTIHAACILPLAKGCPANSPRCGRTKRAYYHSHDARVAARARLSGGSLEATHVEESWDWEFEKISHQRSHVGHLAQEVCHSFEVAGDTLRVSLTRSGTEVGAIELASRAGEPIELRIGNTPGSEIFIPGGSNTNPHTDEHAKLYYELSNPPVPGVNRSRLVRLTDSPNDDCIPSDHRHRLGGGSLANTALVAGETSETGESEASGFDASGWISKAVGGMNCPPALWEQP